MREWTLDTFPAEDRVGAAAKAAALGWLQRRDLRSNLYLFGPVGSGKTGLAWSVAVALQADDPSSGVRFWNVRQLLADVRRSYGRSPITDPNDPEDVPPDLVEAAIRADVLVLDDLGAERGTDWARETLATIIEERYVALWRPVIVTSNYSPSLLARRIGYDDLTLGERIVSRLLDGALKIQLDRRNLRGTGGGLSVIEGGSS